MVKTDKLKIVHNYPLDVIKSWNTVTLLLKSEQILKLKGQVSQTGLRLSHD